MNDLLVYTTKPGHSQSYQWEDESVECEVINESVGGEGNELTVEDFHCEIRMEVFNRKASIVTYDEYVGEVTVELAYWKIFELRKGLEIDLNLSSLRSVTAAGAIQFRIGMIGSPIKGEKEEIELWASELAGDEKPVMSTNCLIPDTDWKILNRTEFRRWDGEYSAYELSIMLSGMTRSISQSAIELWEGRMANGAKVWNAGGGGGGGMAKSVMRDMANNRVRKGIEKGALLDPSCFFLLDFHLSIDTKSYENIHCPYHLVLLFHVFFLPFCCRACSHSSSLTTNTCIIPPTLPPSLRREGK